jgi:hypothetical protein
MNWYNRYKNKNKQDLETRLNFLLNRKNWALNFGKKPDLKNLEEEIEYIKNLLGKNKLAQKENSPEWSFPEAEHDYNPNWDYKIDPAPDTEIMRISEDILNNINTKILPEIGMGRAKNAYIKEDKNILARYIFGTAPYPVFVINIDAIKKGAKRYKVNMGVAIESTIMHELGHAIQDWMNLDLDERQAEDFAFNYTTYGQLDKFWERE